MSCAKRKNSKKNLLLPSGNAMKNIAKFKYEEIYGMIVMYPLTQR